MCDEHWWTKYSCMYLKDRYGYKQAHQDLPSTSHVCCKGMRMNSAVVYRVYHYNFLQDLVPDMNLFYEQYASIQPWLQKKTDIKLGEQQLHQSINERAKLVIGINILFLFK